MKHFMLVFAQLLSLCLLPAQTAQQQKSAQTSSQRNPFEAVPEALQTAPANASGTTIEAIEFRGARRLPASLLRALIASRAGGAYDKETLQRDAQALQSTGRFSKVATETEPGRTGIVVRFFVVERPLIRSIEIQGAGNVTIGEVLERWKQRNLRLREETLLNEEELERAAAAIQELLVERGSREAVVTTSVAEHLSPSAVKIVFKVEP